MITVETIQERHSVREYDGGPLVRAEFDALGAVVEECARESGLDIQLVGDNPEVFNVIARFGLIRGCRTHVAFVVDDAKAGDATSGANAAANGATETDCVEMRGARRTAVDEPIGYWGQKIVLAAQDMGLNTCWCALCSRKKSRAVVVPGKKNSPDHCGGPRENARLFTEDEERRGAFFRRMREGAGVVCGGHAGCAAGTYGDE